MTLKDNRRALRIGIKQLTSIVKKKDGDYELVKGSDKSVAITIKIINISTGGLCIESKSSFKQGVTLALEIPKVRELDGAEVTCQVMRSTFREDPKYHVNIGTDKDKSFYEIGLKFKSPNSEYLKQLYKLAQESQI